MGSGFPGAGPGAFFLFGLDDDDDNNNTGNNNNSTNFILLKSKLLGKNKWKEPGIR